jgi:hypothetical protein
MPGPTTWMLIALPEWNGYSLRVESQLDGSAISQ